MLVHLAADAIPLGLCVARQQVPQLLVRLGDCLVVSLLGFLEHLLGLLNLHLARRTIYNCRDGVSRFRSFLEILQCLGPSYNSLGKHLALLGQPLLFDDSEDRCWGDVDIVVGITKLGEQVAGNMKLE